MLLRGRIVVIVSVTLLFFAAVLAIAAFVLVRAAESELTVTSRTDQALLWDKALESDLAETAVELKVLASDQKLRKAMADGDEQPMINAVRSFALDPSRFRLRRLDLIGPDGRLLFSSEGQATEAPLIDAPSVTARAEPGRPTYGLEFTEDEQLLAAVTVAIPGGGMLSAALDATQALTELAQLLDAVVLLHDSKGKLKHATDTAIADLVEPRLLGTDDQIMKLPDGRTEKIIAAPVENSAGEPVATLLTVRDVTLSQARRGLIADGTAVVAALLTILALTGLYGYLRTTLDPLEMLSRMVKGLSRGDTLVEAEISHGKDAGGDKGDEIDRISSAVEVFRQNAIELEKTRFRRARERQRSEVVIRRRMREMAELLEQDARQAILEDLHELEQSQIEAGQGEGEAEAATLLAAAFEKMSQRVVEQHQRVTDLLSERTRDLETVRAALNEREQLTRLRQELDVARALQLDSLPPLPAFTDRTDFNVFASMRPATEVGGDFFDFFLVGPKMLAVAIGDASGKGASAAMFIATARSLMKAGALRGADPGECLETTNQVMAAVNPQMMFATALIALMDTETGHLRISNAGHNPPYIKRADGSVELLGKVCGPALGVVDDVPYASYEAQLNSGDMLFTYTDGVTEANDVAMELFEDHRLRAALVAVADPTPAAAIAEVERVLTEFVGAAAQADDITMLAVKRP